MTLSVFPKVVLVGWPEVTVPIIVQVKKVKNFLKTVVLYYKLVFKDVIQLKTCKYILCGNPNLG